jgi:preprotein translocase subunit YajC
MLLILAQDAEATGSLLGGLLPLILIGLFIWFAMIRPQRKRTQAHRQMQDTLAVGDHIITIGGLYGEVEEIGQDTVDIVVDAEGDVVLRFKRSAIAEILRDEVDTALTPDATENTE